MSIRDLRKEWAIRRALRRLSRQRVALVLQPGNVWVIENAVKSDDDVDVALKTCYMRGWVEPLANAVPRGDLTADGRLPEGNLFNRLAPFYRLTDSGWSVINRSHQLLLWSVLFALLAVLLAVVPLITTPRH